MLYFGSQNLGSHLSLFFLFTIIGITFNFVAYKKRFFQLPTNFDSRRWLIKDTLICIAIYLCVSFILSPLLVKLFVLILGPIKMKSASTRVTMMMLLQIASISLNVLGLGIYMGFQNRMRVKCLWRDVSMKGKTTVVGDFAFGFISWLLAFPVVVIAHQLCELINQFVFKVKAVDQEAVKYLKYAPPAPVSFAIALIAIVIAAPFIEEFIFRGCIQNTLRHYTNSKWSIVISSIIFSAFHYAPSQGPSNFPLLVSLFFFAMYLGFVYEKRRSLFACIALHMAFNAISVFRILVG